ncbi:MAG: hypothetical protein Q7T10_02040 [Rhodoferax sp.]|uniref:hypothetical protein n=1 Tax=Rhodoferax sp. TaxID=50421 RepID=UPI002728413F|nr:hypothetical protein [Rhodoferax sp.]MDO8447571.1 hypothetical protein [Rhodoferax sp.]
MASSAKTAAKSAPKPAPRPAASAKSAKTVKPAASSKAAAAPATAEPSLRFHHSKALRAKTHAVLAALEAAPDKANHGDALADLVADLTQAGMDYYYLRALKLAQVGFVVEQSARLGMSGAVMLINSVSRKFIVRMDKAQLLVVARHIRELA